jgi:hypothetical protein
MPRTQNRAPRIYEDPSAWTVAGIIGFVAAGGLWLHSNGDNDRRQAAERISNIVAEAADDDLKAVDVVRPFAGPYDESGSFKVYDDGNGGKKENYSITLDLGNCGINASATAILGKDDVPTNLETYTVDYYGVNRKVHNLHELNKLFGGDPCDPVRPTRNPAEVTAR